MIIFGRRSFRFKVPKGLIIYTRGSTAPEGWEPFSPANNKMVIGAGGLLSPGAIGGSDSPVNYTGSTSESGAHYLGGEAWAPSNTGGETVSLYNTPAGQHSHPLGDAIYIPKKNNLSLIRSIQGGNDFPVGAVLMSVNTQELQPGLTNILTDGQHIGVSATVGSINESAYVRLGTAGSHRHTGGLSTRQVTGITNWYVKGDTFAGAHGGNVPVSVTNRLKTMLLSLWEASSEKIDTADGMVAMWESDIPPVGWRLCDGTNGTVDLRDCFVRGGAGGSESAFSSGDNTVDLAAIDDTVTHVVNHGHVSGNAATTTISMIDLYHDDKEWTHQHTISSAAKSNISWLPPYYSLSFVQRVI
ncbi:MAG: tail fiber protein [Desulfobacterium sp.]|nr:tail fiber protein [Desulfobacterium sp.]